MKPNLRKLKKGEVIRLNETESYMKGVGVFLTKDTYRGIPYCFEGRHPGSCQCSCEKVCATVYAEQKRRHYWDVKIRRLP